MFAPLWSLRLTWLGMVIVCAVIILGAWTRLADAGLGCPDWPGCYGFLLVPTEPQSIAAAEALYPDAPVDIAKGWLEMIHRYFATGLGFVILLLSLLSWRYRYQLGYPFKHSQLLLAMVILQGIFGAWTVTWKLLPQVVTSHLLGGFMTAGLLMLFLIRLYRMGRPVTVLQLARLSQAQLQMWIIIGLVLLVVQIFLGGWMSANYAAMACSDLPACNGEWWPEQDFRQGFNLTQAMGPNYLGGLLDSNARKAIHITHRIGAVVLTVYMLYLGLLLWRNPDQRLRYLAYITWALITLQFALGLANIYFYLPLPVAVAHNFGAACLFLLMLSLIYLTQSCRRPINE